MRPLLYLFVAWAILNSGVYAEEANKLVGVWRLEGASFPFPKKCNGLWYKFNADGTSESSDGYLHFQSKYLAEKSERGLLIELIHVSDNNKSNCQDLSAEYVRANNSGSPILFRFVGHGRAQVYFGDSETNQYMTLHKVK